MKKSILSIGILLLICFGSSCTKNDSAPAKNFDFDFQTGAQDWQVIFSDYPVGREDQFQLEFKLDHLPPPFPDTVKTFKVSGFNQSDDLLSMLYRKFDGLEPNRTYAVTFAVELASNALKEGIGIGGSPDLAFGVGGLSYKPENQVDTTDIEDFYRPNFSSPLQSYESNESFKMLGRIGVDGDEEEYKLLHFNNDNDPLPAKANENGELWLLMGTDSGFEGTTTLYYKTIKIKMR